MDDHKTFEELKREFEELIAKLETLEVNLKAKLIAVGGPIIPDNLNLTTH